MLCVGFLGALAAQLRAALGGNEFLAMTANPPEEIADLAAGYIRFAEELARDESPDTPEIAAAEQAYELVEKTVRNGPADRAWELVVEILRQASPAT